MIEMVSRPRSNGRVLALADWLRGLHAGGFELEVLGDRTIVSAPIQMTLVDDLEPVSIIAPPQKEAPGVVARRGKRTFLVACTSFEAAQALYLLALERE